MSGDGARDRRGSGADRHATFDDACSLVEAVLTGSTRQEIVNGLSAARDFGAALRRLRECMRANTWKAGADGIDLSKIVRRSDRLTRQDGFHALHDWDGTAERFNDDTIPVDVLNHAIEKRGAEPVDPVALAILVDYHFLYLLALLSLRIWDGADADANVDRLTRLLEALQGTNGSGQGFARDAGTLLLIATSHYEPDEAPYDRLLQRVRTLNAPHRTTIAWGHAVAMGCHLRFGFEATYGRDTLAMRDDNGTDYPWLCFALATLMNEYVRVREAGVAGPERERVVEGILNGLGPDTRAFVGDTTAALSDCEDDRREFREGFSRFEADLLEEFEIHRPGEASYSPLSFFFNFSHNVLKGMVVDAILRGDPWRLTLDDLLTGMPREAGAPKEALARTLMAHARGSPARIRGRLMPVIVYDPPSGRRAFEIVRKKITDWPSISGDRQDRPA